LIPVLRPEFSGNEIKRILSQIEGSLLSGWIGLGPKVAEFEERFADRQGFRYGVGTDSGTSALFLALAAAGIDTDRHRVAVPAFSFVSTAAAVVHAGATPVFGDIDHERLTLRADEVHRLTRESPADATIAATIAGVPPDWGTFHLHRRSVGMLIHDAAHYAGTALWENNPPDSITECYSFHAIKPLTTGEGGMVLTNDEGFADELKRLRWMGIDKSTFERENAGEGGAYLHQYDIPRLGWKMHMNDIQASIGLAQLPHLGSKTLERAAIADLYNAAFFDLGWLDTPTVPKGVRPSWHLYIARVVHGDRESFMRHMNERAIACGVHYRPIHEFAPFEDCHQEDLPVTERVAGQVVSLPCWSGMRERQISAVIEAVRSFQP